MNGDMFCGSTTPTTDDTIFGTPASATTTEDGDYYDAKTCENVGIDVKDQRYPYCTEDCVIGKIKSESRPTFAVSPFGTDCQEWTDNVIKNCGTLCSKTAFRKPSVRY
jgi:hypothetical protein